MPITYNARRRSVLKNGYLVVLSPPQWDLFVLLRDCPRPVPVEEMAEVLYPDRDPVEAEGAARSVLLRLREKLKEIDAEDILVSARGHGYLIILP